MNGAEECTSTSIIICGNSARNLRRLAKGWQLDQIIFGHTFQMSPGFTPGSESADDYERVESFFPQ